MRASAVVYCTLLLSLWMVGCGSSAPTGPVVIVDPATFSVTTGDGPTTFAAVLSNGAVGPVTWTLSGPGSISPTSGDQTAYQPPPLGGSGGTAMLRASAGCGAGCGPVGNTATITVNTATTGTLTISVSGLPSVAPATLNISGPNSYQHAVTTATSTTLNGLDAGAYTVSGVDIKDSTNPIVNGQWTAPPVPATVAANAAASVTVSYASLPGYGRLWVANGTTLDGFTPGDLQVNHAPGLTPTTGGGTVQGIAFDTTGAMWTAQLTPDAVLSYAASGLASSSALTPAVTLTGAPISTPQAVALGSGSQVWVANCATNTVVAYPLAGGASPTVTLSGFACPSGLAFDSAGNLWVANKNGVAERFSKTAISTSGSPAPSVTLTPPTGASQPSAVALDTSGNILVAFCTGGAVARYASGTANSGTPVATLLATGSPPSLDCPVALALDNSGDLFVGNAGTAGPGSGTLAWFAASDVAMGTAAPPLLLLPNVAVGAGGLAFNPTPTGLPLIQQ